MKGLLITLFNITPLVVSHTFSQSLNERLFCADTYYLHTIPYDVGLALTLLSFVFLICRLGFQFLYNWMKIIIIVHYEMSRMKE